MTWQVSTYTFYGKVRFLMSIYYTIYKYLDKNLCAIISSGYSNRRFINLPIDKQRLSPQNSLRNLDKALVTRSLRSRSGNRLER